ncbi:hypothetical protein K0817_004095 [Microbacterium sp. HD4P20]|uniref:hypothetical protein n=1 Tax=Microbacterium sp. HD4P20 TaxID=2864874 RepID=UPI001C63C989|nr:hypothetical protein [Microbacterium sp. HD4P20]MCP2635746.1 hypothetical protein [Microbacterium sp. HD4P20]
MSDQPRERHSDDIETDTAPPTEAVTDEVKEDAARAEDQREAASDRPAQTHP